MAVFVLSAAKRLGETSGWVLTNLQMQKMCYLAHMFYMGDNSGDPLVKGQFEAWAWGPVHPTLYHAVKHFNSDPIQSSAFTQFPNLQTEPLRAKYLDAAFEQLPLHRLVAITHWSEGAWRKNYRPNERGIVISNSDILEEYQKRKDVRQPD